MIYFASIKLQLWFGNTRGIGNTILHVLCTSCQTCLEQQRHQSRWERRSRASAGRRQSHLGCRSGCCCPIQSWQIDAEMKQSGNIAKELISDQQKLWVFPWKAVKINTVVSLWQRSSFLMAMALLTHQISLWGHVNQYEVIADTHFLTLWPLPGWWMDNPPTSLT